MKYAGFTVQHSSTPAGLTGLLQEHRPRALLMDMLLSGADGRDICRQLKQDNNNSHIRVIMMSAHPDAEQTCKEAGADDFIEKPFEIDIFLGKIKKAVEAV